MIDSFDPKVIEKPVARCEECDREVTSYNNFITPENLSHIVCWECMQRAEKGFFAHRGFSRGSRFGVIPR